MTSNLKFLACAAAVVMTCATTHADPPPLVASPAPVAGHRPALLAEPQLTLEEERALRTQLAECQKFAGLAHYAAEAKAIEMLRTTHGADPRFEQCLVTFRELAASEAILEEKDPRGRDCVHEITEDTTKDLRSITECVERTVDDIDRNARKLQALIRQEELRPAHDECFSWLGLDERFFFLKELLCRDVEDALRRHEGRGE